MIENNYNCIKCGKKLILDGFAYNQNTRWDCFKKLPWIF